MIVATSATVRNLTSLSEVAASAAIDSPLPACAERVRRTSHARLQRKSCTEKGNPDAGHQFRYFGASPIALWRHANLPEAKRAAARQATEAARRRRQVSHRPARDRGPALPRWRPGTRP